MSELGFKLNLRKNNLEKYFAAISFLIFLPVINALAFVPETYLPEKQETRARELFLQIRCPICAGQVIESSETEISIQLRALVRQQISDGKTDEQIKSYLVDKYGKDILNSPPLNFVGFFLWFFPVIFIFMGVFFIGKVIKLSK